VIKQENLLTIKLADMNSKFYHTHKFTRSKRPLNPMCASLLRTGA